MCTDHGLPKVSPGPVLLYPSKSYGRTTPETYGHFRSGPLAGHLAVVLYPFGHPTPFSYGAHLFSHPQTVAQMLLGSRDVDVFFSLDFRRRRRLRDAVAPIFGVDAFERGVGRGGA
jgi:hypothetical protein